MTHWLIIASIITTSIGSTQNQMSRPFNISDYYREVSLSSPQLSPDGNAIAVLQSKPDMVSDRYVTTLLLVNTSTGSTRRITDGKHGASSPRWSSNGTLLSYVSAGKEGSDQVFALPAAGGAAWQVTHAARGVQQYAWSHDGKRLVYVTPDEDPYAADVRKHDDLFDVHDDGYLTQSRPVPSHLWIVPAVGGTPHRLTHGSWSVLETAGPFQGGPLDPSWSRDDRWITFARQPNADDSDSDRSTIAVVRVASGDVTPLTSASGFEYQPVFSAAGDTVAYLAPHGPTSLSAMDVFTVKPGERAVDRTIGFDHDVTSVQWAPDGRSLLLAASEHIQSGLWWMTGGQAPQRVDLGPLSAADACAGPHGSLAVVASGPGTPPELYFMPREGGVLRKLTSFNASMRRFLYGRVTEVQWSAPDGQANDGVLTYPVGYTPGMRSPLAVIIHGGPEAASLYAFDTDPVCLALASCGYVVFQPNYRGSDNLGGAHEHAIYLDPGEGPCSDVLSGIELLEQQRIVDPHRIAVAGHSYGGFMTAWLIGHDHRWQSAVVSDGLLDWRELYNLSADGNLAMARESLGGTPSEPAAAPLYRAGSPITYADRITTPTLILHGTADETVPITSSYALYHTLHDRHVPVRFVAVPGAHHFPGDPVRQQRFSELTLEWILSHDH